MEKISNLQDLYSELLRDIYNAEVLEVTELLEFKSRTQSAELKEIISTQTSNSRAHIQRLEDMMDNPEESVFEDHCRSMRSLITDANLLVDRCIDPSIKDLGIVHSLQKVTQCKILVYNTLLTMAEQLVPANESRQLKKCLNEEEATFESLNKMMLLNLSPNPAKS